MCQTAIHESHCYQTQCKSYLHSIWLFFLRFDNSYNKQDFLEIIRLTPKKYWLLLNCYFVFNYPQFLHIKIDLLLTNIVYCFQISKNSEFVLQLSLASIGCSTGDWSVDNSVIRKYLISIYASCMASMITKGYRFYPVSLLPSMILEVDHRVEKWYSAMVWHLPTPIKTLHHWQPIGEFQLLEELWTEHTATWTETHRHSH